MEQKTYIEKAIELYRNIIHNKVEWNNYYITLTLSDYGIDWINQPKCIEILGNLLKAGESPLLSFWKSEGDGFEFKFISKEDIIQLLDNSPIEIEGHYYVNRKTETSINTDLDSDDYFVYKFGHEYVFIDIDEIIGKLGSSPVEINGRFYVNMENDPRLKRDLLIPNKPGGQFAIIGTIHIWDCIYHKVTNETSKKLGLYEKLNELGKINIRSFGLFCARYIFKYHKTHFKNYNIDLALLFYSYIWKSIAVGEFFFVYDYKKIISKEIVISDIDDISNDKLYPDFVYYYSDISSAVATFVNRATKKAGKYELHFDLDLGLNVETALEKNNESALLSLLRKLTQKLFHITVIDFNYFTSEANISTLVNFIYGFNSLKENLQTIRNRQLSFSMDEEFGEDTHSFLFGVIDTLLFKACWLMKGMLEQSQPNGAEAVFDYASFSNEDIVKILDKYLYSIKEDDFIKYLKGKEEILCKTIKEKQSEYLSKKYLYEYGPLLKFIGQYNEFINDGIEVHLKNAVTYNLLKDNTNPDKIILAIKDYIDNNEPMYKVQFLSPSILRKSISWLYQYIEKNKKNKDEESHDVIHLYGKALNLLRCFISVYKNGKDTPLRYRPFFEYSYVEIKDMQAGRKHFEIRQFANYNSEEFKDCIFFASFQYNPINIEFLTNFYSLHNRAHRLFESEAIERSIKRSQELKNDVDSNIDTVKEERGRTLQLLGLLGSFIAFITASLQSQNEFKSVKEYLLYVSTFMSAIGLFVLFVYLIASFVRFSKQNMWHIVVVIAPFLIFLIFTIILFFC